jgi:hypothetical protein
MLSRDALHESVMLVVDAAVTASFVGRLGTLRSAAAVLVVLAIVRRRLVVVCFDGATAVGDGDPPAAMAVPARLASRMAVTTVGMVRR